MLPPCVPFHRFQDFINPANDRFSVLDSLLAELNCNYSVVKLGVSRHFILSSPCKEKPSKVLVAHYDSVTGSPGANDNASSVFILISAALQLSKTPDMPWIMIFTDNEELTNGQGIRAQGSYTLAQALKNTGLAGADFYVFDSCGRGATLVISTLAEYLMKNETGNNIAIAQKRLHDLRNSAIAAAERSSISSYMLLPAPFSDDAGFLHAGLAAQMITALPAHEAASFASLSRAHSEYVYALINREIFEKLDKTRLPETWRLLNGPSDTEDKLTADTIPALVKFAAALCRTP